MADLVKDGQRGPPEWLGPLTGALSLGTAGSLVAIYLYGMYLPEWHEASRSAVLSAPPDELWSMITEPERRAEWRPNVVRVVSCSTVAGKPCLREFDATGDRIEFVIEESDPSSRRFVLSPAKPEDLGMVATWSWSLEPRGEGTEVTLTERGQIENPLFRGLWALQSGPHAVVEPEIEALQQATSGPR